MKVTYYGHSSFLVEIDNISLLFDPFITGNDLAKGKIDIHQIKPDYIVLSHGHQDHILDAEAIARHSGAPIISNFEIIQWYGDKNIDNGIPMNHGGTVNCDGVLVKMVNAIHTSSFPDGSYAGQPAGFVVNGINESFYYSGDTALHYDMKLVGDAGGVDHAFLCLGDHFTMGADDAIRASQFVKTTNVIAMHFDTFDPIKIDRKETIRKFDDASISLCITNIGETYTF
jgi:L-ascorbate metabolism protein UlaG (beta-lactamase superfamily)